MKKLLLAFVLLLGLGLTAQAQRYVGTFVGNGAGLTNIPTSALSPNVVTNNGTLTLGLPIVGDGGRGGYPSNALTLSSATITTGVFETAYGDGSGITNIYAKNVITQTNNWLVTAWAADGADRSVNVTIPTLGSIDVVASATGTVYTGTSSPLAIYKSPSVSTSIGTVTFNTVIFGQAN